MESDAVIKVSSKAVMQWVYSQHSLLDQSFPTMLGAGCLWNMGCPNGQVKLPGVLHLEKTIFTLV